MELIIASSIVEGALGHAEKLNLKPLSVAVVDAGGHLVAFQRQYGSSTLRPQIAIAKATSALALGVSTRQIGAMAAERPTFIAALGSLAPEGIIPAAGGVLVADREGRLLGSVGVTGDTSDNDEACALAAIVAAGLEAFV